MIGRACVSAPPRTVVYRLRRACMCRSARGRAGQGARRVSLSLLAEGGPVMRMIGACRNGGLVAVEHGRTDGRTLATPAGEGSGEARDRRARLGARGSRTSACGGLLLRCTLPDRGPGKKMRVAVRLSTWAVPLFSCCTYAFVFVCPMHV
jgi:hypothetical protein